MLQFVLLQAFVLSHSREKENLPEQNKMLRGGDYASLPVQLEEGRVHALGLALWAYMVPLSCCEQRGRVEAVCQVEAQERTGAILRFGRQRTNLPQGQRKCVYA